MKRAERFAQKGAFVLLIMACLGKPLLAQYAYLDQGLEDVLRDDRHTGLLDIILLLSDAVDVTALKTQMDAERWPVQQRSTHLIKLLQQKAADTQAQLLRKADDSGHVHTDVKGFWLVNAISMKADKAMVRYLMNQPEVAYIELDTGISGRIDDTRGKLSEAKTAGSKEPGIGVIGAPELWAMGYYGTNRIGMVHDTGLHPNHVALADRNLSNRMPLSRSWLPYYSQMPTDRSSSHGTHVGGTMAGLQPESGDTIGVAPKAYLIAADPLSSGDFDYFFSTVQLLQGHQWAIDPDGNPDTTDDMPDVINNSWGGTVSAESPDCQVVMKNILTNVEAAGIANVFSAGNMGPEPSTITRPKNINAGLVNVFATGAVNGNVPGPNYPIAEFSSRGPSTCEETGSLLIKPEVVAPGENVRSAVGNAGAYDVFSGTSMAAPHVSGGVLLLKEAFPTLTGEEVLLALYHTAIDLGEPGEDNDYGNGLIDLKAAFDYLAQMYEPHPPANMEIDIELVEIRAPNAAFRCANPSANMIQPEIRVRNKGAAFTENITVYGSINEANHFEVDLGTVSLQAAEVMDFLLPEMSVSSNAEQVEFHVHIAPLPGEGDVLNNHRVRRWQQLAELSESNFFYEENFDNGFDKWRVIDPGGSKTWQVGEHIQRNGQVGKVAWLNFYSYLPINYQRDHLISPVLSNMGPSYSVSFDYVYKRASSSPNRQDTLEISAVYNCGDASKVLWRKGGAELWTNNTNTADGLPLSGGDWSLAEFIFSIWDLPNYNHETGVSLMFTGINGGANHLLIDNILIDSFLGVNRVEPSHDLSLAPNPANSGVRLNWSTTEAIARVSLHDIQGKQIRTYPAVTANEELSIEGLTPGVYLVEVIWPDATRAMAKLVVAY